MNTNKIFFPDFAINSEYANHSVDSNKSTESCIYSNNTNNANNTNNKLISTANFQQNKNNFGKCTNFTTSTTTIENIFYMASVMPVIFLTWIQFTLNIVILTGFIFGIWKIGSILSSDLDKHIDKQTHLILTDIVQCSRDFIRNNCGQSNTAPALEKTCDTWKLCMEQDTSHIMKSTETAVVLAQILNQFFDNLSNRTIYCSATLLIGTIVFFNLLLSWIRIRANCVIQRNQISSRK
jgi:hypothetical protein